MTQMEMAEMSYVQLKTKVLTDPEWVEENRLDLDSEMMARVSEIAWLIDYLNGVNPREPKGQPTKYGTPNRDSASYRLRKAAGFAYP